MVRHGDDLYGGNAWRAKAERIDNDEEGHVMNGKAPARAKAAPDGVRESDLVREALEAFLTT